MKHHRLKRVCFKEKPICKLRCDPFHRVCVAAVNDITMELIETAMAPQGCQKPLETDDQFEADLTHTFVSKDILLVSHIKYVKW